MASTQMASYIPFLQVLAPSGALLLSGINLSASHLTIPLLYPLPLKQSTAAFTSLYYRGIPVVMPPTVVASLASFALAYLIPTRAREYAFAGLVTLGTVPWTVFVMQPGIMEVVRMGEALDKDDTLAAGKEARAHALFFGWRWQSAVRACMAAVGGAVSLWCAVSDR